VDAAHAQGFAVRLIYVFLTSADLNVARVRRRVAEGGHDVAEAAIRDRRRRSFEQLAWFFEHADHAEIYDNSGAEPRLVVTKTGDDLTIYGRLIAELMAPLEAAVPGLRVAIEAEPKPKKRTASQKRRRRRKRARTRRAAKIA
jgi:hypothetical protein